MVVVVVVEEMRGIWLATWSTSPSCAMKSLELSVANSFGIAKGVVLNPQRRCAEDSANAGVGMKMRWEVVATARSLRLLTNC